MTLDDKQALDIILKRPNKKYIDAAQTYTKKLLMHIKGLGLDKYIEQVEGYESQDILTIRKKYAVSNQAMFARIHRPTDKVFSAKGGSVYYNLGEKQTQQFKEYLSDIVYGYSLKQWLEVFWLPACAYDPMGLTFIEVNSQGNAYPTYKSIMDIYEMQLTGRKVEYVIFKIDKQVDNIYQTGLSAKYTVYRIVDDVSDRLVTIQGDQLKEIPGETFPNYFMRVPASVNSNIYDPVKGMFVSTDDEIIELADQFLREGSVKNVFKNFFGFPTAWGYQQACPECMGTTVQNGRPCDHCKGTGVKSKYHPSERINLPVPRDKDQPVLAPNIAGYISPDVQGWDKMTEELELLEDIMFETLWGTHQADDNAKNETATGKFIDVQPVNDKLNKFSDAEEKMEQFVTDLIGELMFRQAYGGSSVTAGRRYLIETPDEIWLKLQTARKDGSPTSALYDLYNDYLQARYSANAMEMQKMLKLAKIEPLPFVKYNEVPSGDALPAIIVRQKYWYEKWLNRKSDSEILFGELKALQDEFDLYCTEQDEKIKELTEPTEPEPGNDPKDPVPDPANAN